MLGDELLVLDHGFEVRDGGGALDRVGGGGAGGCYDDLHFGKGVGDNSVARNLNRDEGRGEQKKNRTQNVSLHPPLARHNSQPALEQETTPTGPTDNTTRRDNYSEPAAFHQPKQQQQQHSLSTRSRQQVMNERRGGKGGEGEGAGGLAFVLNKGYFTPKAV